MKVFFTKKKGIFISILAVFLAITVFVFAKTAPVMQLKILVSNYYNDKITLYKQQNATLENVDVAFIGDSLTDAYDLTKHYPQYVTANRGIGGDTTFGVQNRLQTSLYDIQPKAVVLLIGGNNMRTMFENFEEILSDMRDNLPQTKLIVQSMYPTTGSEHARNERIPAINEEIKRLADEYGFYYADVHSALFDTTTGGLAQAYAADAVHLNEQGYERVTQVLTPILENLLQIQPR